MGKFDLVLCVLELSLCGLLVTSNEQNEQQKQQLQQQLLKLQQLQEQLQQQLQQLQLQQQKQHQLQQLQQKYFTQQQQQQEQRQQQQNYQQQQFCTDSINDTFDLCGSREGELIRFSSRNINKIEELPADFHNATLNKCGVCRHVYKVGRIYRLSFGAKISVQVAQMLQRCCGLCTKYHQTNLLPPLENNNKTIVDTLDIIYPVYASPDAQHVQGFYYIPVLKVPSAFYFRKQKTEKDMAEDIIFGCLRMWPLLTMCLILSLIAGLNLLQTYIFFRKNVNGCSRDKCP